MARAAADAIRELGGGFIRPIRSSRTGAALALQPLLAKPPRSQALCESAADAIAELRHPAMFEELHRMLTPSETVKIQHSAIRGIGFLGDPRSAELIVPYLRSREPSLQLDAINALKDLKAVENIDSLLELTNASDDSVKQAAWEAIVAFLPSLSETQLANLQTTFHVRKQPDHELAVLEQQAKVFHARDDPQLADTLA